MLFSEIRNLRVVGSFSKVLRKDGLLLFRPAFRDSDFLLDIRALYHAGFATKWKILSSTPVNKGIAMRIAGVDSFKKASFFVGEDFALPEKDIAGKSMDLLIDSPVCDTSDVKIGRIVDFRDTPTYSLVEIELESGGTLVLPFTEQFFDLDSGRVTVLRLE
ncbi:PRC-barrel domain-containing protein [bacterium]|nr:PRC-barrel domain-containing protein [bacterium]